MFFVFLIYGACRFELRGTRRFKNTFFSTHRSNACAKKCLLKILSEIGDRADLFLEVTSSHIIRIVCEKKGDNLKSYFWRGLYPFFIHFGVFVPFLLGFLEILAKKLKKFACGASVFIRSKISVIYIGFAL